MAATWSAEIELPPLTSLGVVAVSARMMTRALSNVGECLSRSTMVGLVMRTLCSPVMRTHGLSSCGGISSRSSARPPSEGGANRTESPTAGITSLSFVLMNTSVHWFAGDVSMCAGGIRLEYCPSALRLRNMNRLAFLPSSTMPSLNDSLSSVLPSEEIWISAAVMTGPTLSISLSSMGNTALSPVSSSM